MANRTMPHKRALVVKRRRKHRTVNQHRRAGARGKINHTELGTVSEAGAIVEQELKNHVPAATPAQITLRPLSQEDQGWIMQATREEMGPIFRETYGYDLNLDNVLQYVNTAQTRMITVNDQLAGYVSTIVDDGGKMNIGSLVLVSHHKRQGYGTRIMKLLEQEARSMGMVELEAFVQSTNQASLNFLRKLGFQEVPSMQPQTIVMVKNLQSA